MGLDDGVQSPEGDDPPAHGLVAQPPQPVRRFGGGQVEQRPLGGRDRQSRPPGHLARRQPDFVGPNPREPALAGNDQLERTGLGVPVEEPPEYAGASMRNGRALSRGQYRRQRHGVPGRLHAANPEDAPPDGQQSPGRRHPANLELSKPQAVELADGHEAMLAAAQPV